MTEEDVMMAIRCCVILMVLAAVPDWAEAQNRVGGHFGFVLPLVTHAQGETTTISDDFVVGFPTGLTLKKTDRVAFDLELVPVIQNDPLDVSLTVHPGVIFSGPNRFAAGLRMAFDVNAASWGFTPLINRSLAINDSCALFAEAVVPIRFQQDFRRDTFTSIGLGIHLGIGF